MPENQTPSLFADRYRFEPLSEDWDRGRSGYTNLVYDMKMRRRSVIKRVNSTSRKLHHDLKNEIDALLILNGQGAPVLYESSHTVYASEEFEYIAIEYIDAIRVESNLHKLNNTERADIINQLLQVLSNAHQMGIVNGDVDIKHLFWNKEKKKLYLIDWGNAKIGINSKNKTEFSYDLARVAEIIYSLVSRTGPAPATGKISLPDDSEIYPGLAPLPDEFRVLCKWAPRTPSSGIQAPYAAKELFIVSQRWLESLANSRKYTPSAFSFKKFIIVGTFFMMLAMIAALSIFLLKPGLFSLVTSVPETGLSQETPTMTAVPELTTPLVVSDTPPSTATIFDVLTPTVAPASLSQFTQVFVLDKNLTENIAPCWTNVASLPLTLNEGLYRRSDANWGFQVAKGRLADDIIQTDFKGCVENRSVKAIEVNVRVNRLEIPAYESSHEFGVFLEGEDGTIREYTIWFDQDKIMYLRVRENGQEVVNTPILVISPEKILIWGDFPRRYSDFAIQIFMEVDNNGMDVIYLLENSLDEPESSTIDPSQMILIDSAMLQTIKNVEGIGLVGRGGKTETIIWDLSLFERR